MFTIYGVPLSIHVRKVIVAALEKRFAELPLKPTDPAQYARALWFEKYVDSQVAPDVIGLFHQKVLGPMLHKKEPDAAVVRRLLLEDLPPKLDYLEASLRGEYLVGARASVADITLASDLAIFHFSGCTLDPARHWRPSSRSPRRWGWTAAGCRRRRNRRHGRRCPDRRRGRAVRR